MSPRLQTEWEGDGPLADTAEPGATNPQKNIYIFSSVCWLSSKPGLRYWQQNIPYKVARQIVFFSNNENGSPLFYNSFISFFL